MGRTTGWNDGFRNKSAFKTRFYCSTHPTGPAGFAAARRPHCPAAPSRLDFFHTQRPIQQSAAQKEGAMQHRAKTTVNFAAIALASASALALSTLSLTAQTTTYRMTVNKERLLNAQNEPQNWLMMNGDYNSHRYSRLTQINRENVKNLRLSWALALGGMQDLRQNGPEAEINPLIDNGFMYTSDGWGGIYKIDARNAQ